MCIQPKRFNPFSLPEQLDCFQSIILRYVENWHGNSGHEPYWEPLFHSIDSMFWSRLVGSVRMRIFETLPIDKFFIKKFYLWDCTFHSTLKTAFFSCGRSFPVQWARKKEKKEGKKIIACQFCFNCMLDYYQEWKLPYVFFGSLHFFHEHVLLRPTAHFSVEVFFYFSVFVPQIKFLLFIFSFSFFF